MSAQGRVATLSAKRSKYGAVPTIVDGHRFASKREAARYSELKLLERAGQISRLELQPELKFEINGTRVFTYRADFSYFEHGKRVWEDSKGLRTAVYRLKKKCIEARHPNITIRET
jgi:hypothetical protein